MVVVVVVVVVVGEALGELEEVSDMSCLPHEVLRYFFFFSLPGEESSLSLRVTLRAMIMLPLPRGSGVGERGGEVLEGWPGGGACTV